MNMKPTPLLPSDKAKDNPLFVVLAILAFLATLGLLSFKASFIAANVWQVGLNETASIQILSPPEKQVAHTQIAVEILKKSPHISNVTIISKEDSKALLRPWLGDVDLPDELPLPILLDVQLKPNTVLDSENLQEQFVLAGIDANIDDHLYWAKALGAKARAVQILSVIALLLIALAILSACIFAVRAGILARQTLMDILRQIGAAPHFTAQIFSIKFALTSFKAGLVGAGGGFLVLLLLSTLFGSHDTNSLLPGFKIGIDDIVPTLFVPILMGIISGLTTWYTIVKSLHREIYS